MLGFPPVRLLTVYLPVFPVALFFPTSIQLLFTFGLGASSDAAVGVGGACVALTVPGAEQAAEWSWECGQAIYVM